MPSPHILVAYTTNAGTTTDVAELVGIELEKGCQVTVRRLEEIESLEPYTAVVVGAPMLVGWSRAARRFVRLHQDALSRVPVAYFFTAMNLTQTPASTFDGVPFCVDPQAAKPPKHPSRLGFKERYALPASYLRPVLKDAPRLKPVSAGFFGGRMAMYSLKWWQALFVLVIIQARPGGSHNKAFIQNWAAGLF